ncbi:SRPBCC family protein [Microbulbifer sp. EKSA005]|uniref:SRPBCC family protein n=1 Tax=Microbulbifer sp. EKSA005 TaxID=3243364 RepID=UPI0040431754
MILLAEVAITVKRPINTFFEYVTNMENYGEWFPGVTSIASHNELPHGMTGKTYQEVIVMPEGEATLVIEVKKSRLNQDFYTEGDLLPLLPAMLMEFNAETPKSTRFNLKYFSRSDILDFNSDVIKEMKLNLGGRISIAVDNLQRRFS